MKKFIFLVILLLSLKAFPQVFTGKVVDKITSDPLEYANIGVIGRNIGGISLQSGDFSIDMSQAKKTDVIKVSYIGYESFSIPVNSIDFSSNHKIALKPIVQNLEPVVIAVKNESHNLGNQKAGMRHTGWGDFKSLKGRSRGILIEGAECPVKVKTLSFRINHNEWDSVAFRLNFLKYENGKVGESILAKNIFITTSLRHKWVKVDLTDQDIVLCSSVIVVLEWVDSWGKVQEGSSNLLTLSLSKVSSYMLIKEPGEEVGTLVAAEDTPAMFLEVFGN